MKTSKNICRLLTAAGIIAGALFTETSCTKFGFREGGSIRFSASNSAARTRTSYSKEGRTGSDGLLNLERIDWKDGDLITIYSPQAVMADGTDPVCDYRVDSHETLSGNLTSRAKVSPNAADRMLVWGTGTHYFYAVYPSAETEAFTAAEKAKTGLDDTRWKGTVAADQSPLANGLGGTASAPEIAAKMQYAHMFATATYDADAPSVDLPFFPEFTAFEFQVGSGKNPVVDLTSFTLTAAAGQNALAGDFAYLLADVGTETTSDPLDLTKFAFSNTSQGITVDFTKLAAGKLTVESGKPVTFTVIALPQQLSGLSITFTGDQIGTRTLKLNDSAGTPLVYAARQKHRIYGLSFPSVVTAGGEEIEWDQEALGEDILWDYDYVLQHTGTAVTLSDGTVVKEVFRYGDTSGATTTAPFDSYRTSDGGATKEDASVTYEYAEADADGLPLRTGGEIAWTSTMPSTLNSVNATGDVNKTFSADVSAYSFPVVDVQRSSSEQFIKHTQNLKSRTAVGTSVSPYDLSMYDIHGVSRGNRPVTANSYVVDRAGWYMFPIVYGNAIDYTKAGSSGIVGTLYNNGVNAYAYKDAASPADNENYVWHNFQNFTGTSLISTPYVLDDCGDLSSSDAEAVVVWQDVESATYSFIENVSVTNIASSGVFYDPKTSAYKTSVPYIKFQVPAGTIDPDETKDPFQRVTGIRQGNAVIAVRLKESKTIGGTEYAAGTILWSWHIWITDGFDTDGDHMGDGLASIPVTLSEGVTIDVMPVNLGWCDTETRSFYKNRVCYVRVSQTSGSAEPIVFRVVQTKSDIRTRSCGTYYQWGRKDPFIPTDERNFNSVNKAAYSPASYTLADTRSYLSFSSSPEDNASTAIQNPFTIYSSSTYNWMSAFDKYNLWDMLSSSLVSTFSVYRSSFKTVYDPCPPEYCVPYASAFRTFTRGSSSDYSDFNVEDRNGDGFITSADYELGWYFYTNSSKTQTVFFPGMGLRYFNRGQISWGSGCYWYSTLIEPQYGGMVWFNSTNIEYFTRWHYVASACAVRPVQE